MLKILFPNTSHNNHSDLYKGKSDQVTPQLIEFRWLPVTLRMAVKIPDKDLTALHTLLPPAARAWLFTSLTLPATEVPCFFPLTTPFQHSNL